MGARGKKRVRANGQIASGKQQPFRPPPAVPSVKADQVQEGLAELRAAVAKEGATDPSSFEWQTAYEAAQDRLQARHPRMLADAILWRATLLSALIDWEEFRERHRDDGELPTAGMLQIAATIPSHGGDTSFDTEMFEKALSNHLA